MLVMRVLYSELLCIAKQSVLVDKALHVAGEYRESSCNFLTAPKSPKLDFLPN